MNDPQTVTPVEICRWANQPAAGDDAPVYVEDTPDRPLAALAACQVVLPIGGLERARLLLSAGCPTVFIGAAALADASIVGHLAKEFGSARLGVFVRTRRMSVSWTIDRVSNADFKCITPSLCEPSWEILDGQGAPTGTLAGWWLAEMARLGAGNILIHTAIDDDQDLNICATLIEKLGERTLISLAESDTCPLRALVELAGVRRFVLPPNRFADDPEVIALRDAARPPTPAIAAAADGLTEQPAAEGAFA
jgi:hypothetical protein